MAPSASAYPGGASGSLSVVGIQPNGLVELAMTVTPASGACPSVANQSGCSWSAYVSAGQCDGGPDNSPTVTGSSSAVYSGDIQMDVTLVSGDCILTLNYSDGSTSGWVPIADASFSVPDPSGSIGTPTYNGMTATAPVSITQQLCPGNGSCDWFGTAEAQHTAGCLSYEILSIGPIGTTVWSNTLMTTPGTYNGTMSVPLSTTQPTWVCLYVQGPQSTAQAPAPGAILVAEQGFNVAQTTTTTTATSTPAAPAAPPKYSLTTSNAGRWAQNAIFDQFYRHTVVRLGHFAISGCHHPAPSDPRYACRVRWSKGSWAYSGSVLMGNVNAKTGYFRFGFNLVAQNSHTHKRRRINVAY